MCKIPEKFFDRAAAVCTLPLACISLEHRFLWVNHAWEAMVGFSEVELRDKTWMDITKDEDIGGDWQSAQEVLEDERTMYTTQKRYVRKDGSEVSVSLNVWRHPVEGNMQCFLAQAIPLDDAIDLRKTREEMYLFETRLQQLENRQLRWQAGVDWITWGIAKLWPVIVALAAGAFALLKWYFDE